jgi:hypothetical protein
MLIISPHTKFHIPGSNNSSFSTVKVKTKYKFHAAAIISGSYMRQGIHTYRCVDFISLLPFLHKGKFGESV